MRALFHFEEKPSPAREPIHADIPELNGAELASVYYGYRMAGDFYDFIRVAPNRVLFGLLDVAGGLEGTRPIVSAAQQTFRTVGTDLYSIRAFTPRTEITRFQCIVWELVIRHRHQSA